MEYSREIYLKRNDEYLLKYALQIYWANIILKANYIDEQEYSKLICKLKEDYLKK